MRGSVSVRLWHREGPSRRTDAEEGLPQAHGGTGSFRGVGRRAPCRTGWVRRKQTCPSAHHGQPRMGDGDCVQAALQGRKFLKGCHWKTVYVFLFLVCAPVTEGPFPHRPTAFLPSTSHNQPQPVASRANTLPAPALPRMGQGGTVHAAGPHGPDVNKLSLTPAEAGAPQLHSLKCAAQ